jgi:7,8-dihydro-6-hydroxymethylpterin-pyrophosphokinase
MHQRRFVLQPMCDIDPHMVHPVLKKDMQSLRDAMGKNEQRIIQIK